MKIRPLAASAALSLAAFLTLTVAPAVSASAAPAAVVTASPCHADTPALAPSTTDFYDPAQPAFGPTTLPVAPPVGPLLLAYHRFGLLTETAFAAKYRSGTSWIYPPDDGFLVIGGHRVEYTHTLFVGDEIDRFGYPGGAYLSPAGTLFTQRALPPQNLNTPTGTTQANYHDYGYLVEENPV